MATEYNELSENAKVWIYPSSKKFHTDQLAELETKIEDFLKTWMHDGAVVKSAHQIKYNRFIILITETIESLPTSVIDEMVLFISSLEKTYDALLMDKMNPCFKQGMYVQYKDLKAFKKLIKDKAVNKKTIVFDNMVSNKADYETFWEIPAHESWYAHLFK